MINLVFLFIIILTSHNVSGLNINELESNPPGKDSGNEWVELYSDVESSLEGYSLENGDGGIFNLSGSINGYLVIVFSGLWLDNSNETVFLKLNGQIVDEVPVFADSKNNDMTFSLCEDEWVIKESTKGEENNCDNTAEEQTIQEEADEEINNSDEILNSENNLINNSVNLVKLVEQKKSVKITLGNPSSAKEKDGEITKTYKTRIGIIYFFIGICVLLVVLMALRKL